MQPPSQHGFITIWHDPEDHSRNIWNNGKMNFKKLTKPLQNIMDQIMSHFPSLFGLLGN
jgi:hypothetical protein